MLVISPNNLDIFNIFLICVIKYLEKRRQMSEEALERRINHIIESRLSKRTRIQYANSLKVFTTWIQTKYPNVLDASGNISVTLLSTQILREFIASLPEELGISRLRAFRSAIMNEFVAANIRPSEEFSIQVGSFFKGLKKIQA